MLETQEGSLWEVLLWLVIVCATISPVRIGRALLVARQDLLAGLQTFLGAVSNRMTQALVGLLVAAVVLHFLDRFRRKERWVRFDQALDLAAYLLVPYLLLACLGALMSRLGLEVRLLPHRTIKGDALTVVLRCLIAFSWSLVLFGVLAYRIWKGPAQDFKTSQSF